MTNEPSSDARFLMEYYYLQDRFPKGTHVFHYIKRKMELEGHRLAWDASKDITFFLYRYYSLFSR